MVTKVSYVSEDEFWDSWGVIQKSDGVMFEYADVKGQPVCQVWTIVGSGSDENENWYAMPGIHFVNRMGYVMTKRSWSDGRLDAIYFMRDSI